MIIKTFQVIDFDKEFESLKNLSYVGFAHFYLEKTESVDEIDIEVYTQLVELDTRLGTTASEQLYWCLNRTSRSDIIKVASFV